MGHLKCALMPCYRYSICALIIIISITHAALPPGYEDELYCPPGNCLIVNPRHKKGWCGPRTQYYVCIHRDECAHHDETPATITHPKGWGNLMEQSIKDEIISSGLVLATNCPPLLCHHHNDSQPLVKGMVVHTNGLFIGSSLL